MLRGDYIFSVWVYVFWILYILNIFTFFNPKILLILCFFIDVIIIFFMFYYKTNLKKIVVPSLIVVFIIKIIPLYTLRNNKIQIRDCYYSLLLLFIYLLWLHINNISLKKINNTLKGIIFKSKPLIYSLKYYNEYILK